MQQMDTARGTVEVTVAASEPDKPATKVSKKGPVAVSYTHLLNIEIGNLRQEFLHLEFISPLLHYRIANVTEVTFFRLYILGSNVGSGTHSILILVELSLAVGLKNIDRRISVSISPNGEPLVCPGPIQ